MLRKIRITAAAVFFTVITLLLLDFTGTLHAWFGWMAKVQLLPAVLAVNAGVVAALVLLTLLFGRVYCSVICPLGVFQDVVSRAAARRRKNRFRYSRALSWLRYGILVLFLVALAAHFKPVSNLLAPYSAYGRIVSNLFAPLYLWGNNLLAYLAERAGSYAFYTVDVWVKGAATLAVAAVTFIVLAVLAWRNGRTYCNTVCPVGTILGLVSRFAVFKPRIDASKCNGCGLCARNCKASCIDAKAHRIDYSRCVACMDCLGKCRQGAISFSRKPAAGRKPDAVEPAIVKAAVAAGEPADASRRKFLSLVGGMACATVRAQEKKVDGGLAVIEQKKIPRRTTPITPPGSLSMRNMEAHCTGCQLCVAVCPNQVLRPSGKLMSLMVFGELRRSAVRLCLDAGTLCVTPYMGLGMTRRYDMHDFDGVTTSVLVSRGEVYEYRYLLKGGRREVRLSSCYLKNYAWLSTAIGACCPDRGERPMDFWLELKELFR